MVAASWENHQGFSDTTVLGRGWWHFPASLGLDDSPILLSKELVGPAAGWGNSHKL